MASDYLLEIDTIEGGSGDKTYPKAIEVDSFSWGASNAGSHNSGGGGGAGKVSMQDLHFTTGVNKASPNILLACASGQHIKKATLHVRKQGGKAEEYYKITLEDLLVSSYQSGGHAGGDSKPTDQFSLNYTKITFDYKPQKSDGSLDKAVTTGWNVKTGVKV
jgi:type VI secretion system secreted protein Hcp